VGTGTSRTENVSSSKRVIERPTWLFNVSTLPLEAEVENEGELRNAKSVIAIVI